METMRKGLLLFYFLFFYSLFANAQYSLTGTTYSQDFNGLGTTISSGVTGGDLNLVNPLLNGWYFLETGSNANTTITAGTGSANAGDSYNYGISSNSNRKLGGLQSGSLNPRFGLYFINNTLTPITTISLNYTGETWRVGNGNRPDRLDFQYSTNATSLSVGAWTDFDLLDYENPGQAVGNGSIQHSVSISANISGLNIPIGGTFFIRWIDFDAPLGADDGMAIDDFSMTVSYTPPSTDYFRSMTTGLWNDILTWESSPTGLPGSWSAATQLPTSAANTIIIQTGHTVTISASTSADQLVIQNGGVLIFSAGTFILEDGSGYDIDIQNGGVFTLAQASAPPTYGAGTPTISIGTGGILRISAAGLTGPGTGVNANNFVYGHQSILEYTLTGGFSTVNVTFFPNVNSTTIPIFRTTANSPTVLLVGAATPTIFNGVFDCSGTAIIRWQNEGDRTFRNGIMGQGNMDYEVASVINGKFIINGTTAELGGTGTITIPPGGLNIGTNTIVSMTSDKTVNGNISLLSNSYVNLGQYNLTNTGSISGGTTNYIRTDGTGSLILGNVTGLRNAAIGYNSYNPLTITHNAGHNWSVRIEDAVQVLNPNPPFAGNVDGAVLREWHITPSVYPLAAGADIVFGYDDNPAASPRQTGTLFNTSSTVQVWHEVPSTMPWGFDWVAAGVTQVPTGSANGPRTASLTNWSLFSSFAVSTFLYPLPIKLTRFDAVKLNASRAMVSWELAACCSKEARFELEKSTDGRNYILLTTLAGSESSKQYSYTDNLLTAGTTWYRLKATDADGKITYSRVATIVNDDSGGLVVTLSPNPAGEQAVVSVTAAKKATVQFSIISSSGVVMKQWQQAVAAGTQTAAADISALPSGIYQLLCQSEAERVVVRFVKN